MVDMDGIRPDLERQRSGSGKIGRKNPGSRQSNGGSQNSSKVIKLDRRIYLYFKFGI